MCFQTRTCSANMQTDTLIAPISASLKHTHTHIITSYPVSYPVNCVQVSKQTNIKTSANTGMVAVTEMCATWCLICHLLIAKKAGSGGAPYRQRHPCVRFKRKKNECIYRLSHASNWLSCEQRRAFPVNPECTVLATDSSAALENHLTLAGAATSPAAKADWKVFRAFVRTRCQNNVTINAKKQEVRLTTSFHYSSYSKWGSWKKVTGSTLPNILSFPPFDCSFFHCSVCLFGHAPSFSTHFSFFGCQGRTLPYMVKQTMENVCGGVSGRLRQQPRRL